MASRWHHWAARENGRREQTEAKPSLLMHSVVYAGYVGLQGRALVVAKVAATSV